MKILQVISYFNPKFGGDVNVCYNLSQQLAKRNHEVTIITTDFGFDLQYADIIRSEGVAVIPFRCTANFGFFIYSPSIKTWLEKNLKEYDIIHFHNFRSYQNVAVYTFAMKFGIPYIVQAHGSVLPFFKLHSLKKCFDAVWGNNILKNAAICIALTKTESDQYIKMGVPKNRIVIIPNCIDLFQYADLPSPGKFRLKYQIPENERIILFLGRINRIKGIDLLVKAFSQLCYQMSNIKLVIVGPDDGFLLPVQKQIRELQLENRVLFTGPLFGKDKLEAYIDADIFVLPSRYETFPLTVLEAWACGTPVILSEGCLFSEFLPNKEIIFEFDKNRMKDLIQQILTDNEFKLKLKNESEQLIKNQFNWSKVIENYVLMYSGAIKETR